MKPTIDFETFDQTYNEIMKVLITNEFDSHSSLMIISYMLHYIKSISGLPKDKIFETLERMVDCYEGKDL